MNGAAPVESAQKVAGGLFGSPTIERILKAFCYRDFRVLWFGSFTSSIGTWMQSVAENWLVFSLTSSAFFLGLDAFLQQIDLLEESYNDQTQTKRCQENKPAMRGIESPSDGGSSREISSCRRSRSSLSRTAISSLIRGPLAHPEQTGTEPHVSCRSPRCLPIH